MTLKAKLQCSTFLCISVILSACGGGSGSNSNGGTTPPTADTAAPAVSFNPTTLSVESGQTGTSTLTATDAVGVTTGPTVTCTNGGRFADNTFTAPTGTADTTSVCTATASDAAGNEGSATLMVTVTEPNPQASVNSNVTTVMEGQPFVLDASASSDPDGDNLTYSWAQTSGTAVVFNDTVAVIQNLTAPDITVDEVLTFEVTVSDGQNTSKKTVEINVNNIEAVITSPTIPSFANLANYDTLIGITSGTDAGYSVYWGRDSESQFATTSSQNFTSSGSKVEDQIDGEFQGTNDFDEAETIKVLSSGNTLYYVNLVSDRPTSDTFRSGFATHRGLVDARSVMFGDRFIDVATPLNGDNRIDAVPIGDNQLLSVSIKVVPHPDTLGDYQILSHIIQPDGTSDQATISAVETGASPNPSKEDVTAAEFNDGSYIVIWKQSVTGGTASNPGNAGGIVMRHANMDGSLLGAETFISEEPGHNDPSVAVMTDGNAFVTWTKADSAIMGRIIHPNGAFITEEFVVSDTMEFRGAALSKVTALKTDHVLVAWRDNTGDTSTIRAQVFDNIGAKVGNEYVLAGGDEIPFHSELLSATLDDNQVIIGWDLPSPDNSRTVRLYPIGK